jgi:hypothetical protein
MNPHKLFILPTVALLFLIPLHCTAAQAIAADQTAGPPVITTQPRTQTALADSVVSFTVEATGDAPLYYQWQKDGADIEGATAPTLTVPNVQTNSAGTYQVTVGDQKWFNARNPSQSKPQDAAKLKSKAQATGKKFARFMNQHSVTSVEAVLTVQPQPVFQGLPLDKLLASQDGAVSTARARNRALIEAKGLTFSDLLRNKKTADLTSLAIQIEQTILDLNHESETCKDRAQQAAEHGTARENDVAQLRELALVYKERIEILKPILTAIKDEIANRNK